MHINIEIIKEGNNDNYIDLFTIQSNFKDLAIATDLGDTIRTSSINYPNLLIYNKNYFERGIRLKLNEKEDKKVYLGLDLPASSSEIHRILDLVKFIKKTFVDAKIIFNKIEIEESLIDELRRTLVDKSSQTLREFVFYKENEFNLKLARFDYYITKKDLETLSTLSLDTFIELIRKIQSDNKSFVALPTFFNEDGKEVGYYITTENVVTILPRRLIYKDVIYKFAFNVPNKGKVIFDYNEFMNKLKKSDYEDFDIFRIKLKQKTLEEIKEISERKLI